VTTVKRFGLSPGMRFEGWGMSSLQPLSSLVPHTVSLSCALKTT